MYKVSSNSRYINIVKFYTSTVSTFMIIIMKKNVSVTLNNIPYIQLIYFIKVIFI